MSSCQHRQTCIVTSSDAAFSNPCPSTYKYLRLSFDCISLPQVVSPDVCPVGTVFTAARDFCYRKETPDTRV